MKPAGPRELDQASSVALAFQVARIFNEERFLSRYPEYRRYQRLTRWRLIPFVF